MKRFYLPPLVIVLFTSSPLLAKKFYPDDPLTQEPAPINVDHVQSRELSRYYDLFSHTLGKPGERNTKRHVIRSKAIDTLGDPMDGAWYTKRHYWKPMSNEELMRGPGGTTPPSMEGPWTIVSAKTQGITPGFTMMDSKGRRYYVKFDPLNNPEMATAADMISTRFFHALGYHVWDTYLVYFDIERLVLGQDVRVTDKKGKRRKMTHRDILEILLKVPKTKDDKYRGFVSLQLPGKSLGPFRFFGVRDDDPNDIVPHEHRRDLRAYYVFCAWLDHDDSRAVNTKDMLVEENGVKYLRHNLIDFGATLGSSTSHPNSPRAGGEYLFSWGPTLKEIVTLGLWVPRWALAKYPNYPSIGKIEADVFDPERWYPEYPNPAFENRLPDDEFWAAKQVMAFTDDQIRAIVKTGQLSDPDAEQYLVDCLIRRRDKIGKTFFAKVLPLDRFSVRDGELVFEDLAKKHGMGVTAPLKVSWSRFDNETEKKTPLSDATSFAMPKEAFNSQAAAYYAADISRDGDTRRTITVYVRSHGQQQPQVVGIDRLW
ncbi:MAG: hypothetical protein DMG06_06440 [Acidobacteria bacterium]|nr:MAG: hypothetical protein DMG06_06440 [Acidobacteriota bacterium]